MSVYSVIYRPDIDTYYLYDSEGKRIRVTEAEPPIPAKDSYAFSFHDDYNSDKALAWAQLLETLEVHQEVEYFRQAEMGTGNMQDIIARITHYWLDRGRKDCSIPGLVDWSRQIMVDPGRHESAEKVSTLYVGSQGKSAVETVFARYVELVKSRKYQNYGHFWPNDERISLLISRIAGIKFKNIAKRMGRTEAACRSIYGRIRRGDDSVFVDIADWELFRETLPLGAFPVVESPGMKENETDKADECKTSVGN